MEPQQGEAMVQLDPPKTMILEVDEDTGKVFARLYAWMKSLKASNGGYGEVTMEIKDGKVYRVRPTDSWLASQL